MPAQQLQIFVIAAIAALALLLALRQWQLNRRMRRELNSLRRELENRSIAAPPSAPASFSASLDQVERQQAPAVSSSRSSTEKYRYIAALAGEGMNVKGIASVLQLSTAEVEQLLQLARLKQPR